MNKKMIYDVDVKQVTDGFKVVVKQKEMSTTRNTRVGFSPERLIGSTLGVIFGKKKTINAGVRVYAGKKKTETKIIDSYEMVLDYDKWQEQLNRWVEIQGFNNEVLEQIKKEIEIIIQVKGI